MPSPEVIRSTANPGFRQVRELLQSARARRTSGSSVLEGLHLVDAWLQSGAPLERLVVAESALGRDALRHLPLGSAMVLADRLFEQLGTMPSAAPVIAVVRTPSAPLPARLDGDALVLDRVQDPGNVGAILRTAAAAGIARVLTTPQTAWCWSPKVLRAAMGGHFALAIHESVDWEAIRALAERSGLPLAATLVDAPDAIDDTDLTPNCVWVFGNEGEGLDPARLQPGDWRLRIAHSPRVESLNVAAAAAVCLFEQRRQRRAAVTPGRAG